MVEHILVIGGGIMGVCTAYYISQHEKFQHGGISVTIVEIDEIAGGASGKAAGFLALDWHGAATSSLAALSYTLHQELAATLNGESRYGYRKLTSLNCKARASMNSEEPSPNPALADSNLEFRPKPPSMGQIQAKWLDGSSVQSVDVVSGEDTTAQVHPALLTKTLFELSKAHGVQYVKGRPARWNKKLSEKTMTIEMSDEQQDIRADTVVLAAGPWTGRVAKELLGLDIPITDLPGHSILIRPTQPLPAHAVFLSIYGAQGMTGTPEMVARPDGLVYVAGENTGAPLPSGTADVKIDPDAIRKLVKASSLVSSVLAGGVVEVEQLCYRPISTHGIPLVGALTSGNDKVFVAAGHGPWGISLGPGTGKVMAELILDGAVQSADISQLSPSQVIKV